MTQKKRDVSPALLALTTSAMALPGIIDQAQAAISLDGLSTSYRYTAYREHDIDRSKTTNDDTSRYDIDVHQFQLITPVKDRFMLTLDTVYETMSGASPKVIIPDAEGKPIQVMSGATIEEKRIDGSVKLEYSGDKNLWTGTVGISDENDYRAYNASLGIQTDVNQKLTTVSAGMGFSRDEIEPTGGGTPQYPLRVASENKHSIAAFGGVSHIFTPFSTLQTSLSATHLNGFLSDPYKEVFVVDTILADSRPEKRTGLAWLTRYRHFIPKANGALSADYRLYYDDWDITSHTMELGWHQNLGFRWQVSPSARYYSQSQAKFYSPYYSAPRADGFYSGDYRLSPYGALNLRLKAKMDLKKWTFNLAAEHYMSSGGLALGSVNLENPALLDFTMVTMGVDFKL